jgi:hypothetical protein
VVRRRFAARNLERDDDRNAQVPVDRIGTTWLVGDPAPAGRSVSTEATMADGIRISLQVRGDAIDEVAVQAQLQRFVRPMVAALALEERRRQRSGQARDAVATIEQWAVTDLATGIVMARRDCDPETARGLIADWSARTGVDLQTLTPVDVLELFTAAQNSK